jgi:hypothetical protein
MKRFKTVEQKELVIATSGLGTESGQTSAKNPKEQLIES